MKKAIVTTTINAPTKALKLFVQIAESDGWDLIVVGDKKTPHEGYELADKHSKVVTYLDPAKQEAMAPKLSKLIGWNCIQRRNFGLLYAYQQGAEVIATVDDDNIPKVGWGQNCLVNRVTEATLFATEQAAFDPLAPHMRMVVAQNPGKNVRVPWHRGFPIQMLEDRLNISEVGVFKRKVLVQADLWDGDPDIDAICRIGLRPHIEFNPKIPVYSSNRVMPFNSQNTFLSRDIFPDYFLFPHVGRMDDIWAAFVTQLKHPESVVFSRASVKQERNPHDLFKDLKAEMLGYEHNAEIVSDLSKIWKFIPMKSLEAYDEYKRQFSPSVQSDGKAEDDRGRGEEIGEEVP